MKHITDYIKRYDNILSDDICDKICKNTDEKSFNTAIVNDGYEVKSYRKCFQKNLDEKYHDYLYKGVSEVLQKYQKDHANFYIGLSIEDTGYEHLLYKGSEKGEYKTHIDAMDLYPRVLSISFLLNDNYDGGDFVFFEDMSYTVKKKKGSAVVFPSNFCFPHAVIPVTNGNRQSIITWVH
tara:strand:- start:97 stop:636 length:540 start_codon:yes stop_codon:yes gene_type:complete